MAFQLKKNELTESIIPRDNQLQQNDNPIFNRRCFTMLISGSKGSGKTSLLLSLLSTPKKQGGLMKEFDRIYLVSPTARNDAKLDELVEELESSGSFYDEFSNEIQKEIMDDIQAFNNNFKKKKKPHILVIYDDVISSLPNNRKKGQSFNKFMTCNRHMNCSIVILTQRMSELSPLIRSQADLICYFKSNNKKENTIFIDTFGVSEDMMNFCCEDNHTFMTVSFMGKKPLYFKKFDEVV
jgi:hypothetical protein